MAVVNRPCSARLEFTTSAGRVVQSLTRVRSNLTNSEVFSLLGALSQIHPTSSNDAAAGGRYIVSEEIAEA
jgi:hypothetical protein